MATVDQAALDKKVRERRAKNKKLAAERKKAKRLKRAYKKEAGLKWYQKAPKDIKEKATKKSKAKETGEVRRGAKGVKSTKGGEYVKYGKKSKAAKSFKSAFAEARKEGKKSFSWDGRSYSTARADDKKKTTKPKGLTKKEKEAKDIARHQKRLDAHRKHLDKVGVVSPPSIKKVTKGAITESMKGDKKDKTLTVKKPSNPPLIPDKVKKKAKDIGTKGVIGSIISDELKKRESTGHMAEGGKVESYSKGGKVESNPYGWPSSDARGKK